jgi:hypothetical protein
MRGGNDYIPQDPILQRTYNVVVEEAHLTLVPEGARVLAELSTFVRCMHFLEETSVARVSEGQNKLV